MSVGFVTCPACFAAYPRMSIHCCTVDAVSNGEADQKHFTSCVSVQKVAGPNRREQRIAFLERKRRVTIEDLKVKVEAEDWHGCQDCGSDLRDIDNELDGLRY